MTLTKTALSTAIAGAAAAGMLLVGGAPVSAQPAPPPLPALGEQPPAWAPPKPAEVWIGQPVVWNSAWGGRWGVWINGGWISLTSNPVTGGG
ncbi:hypothetical protein CRI77_21260 [Mycolicibacterium duvalii]|uniref:Uncharacterized protein n=1 Tax=Mycolicibacterium duvalii TaxID=39688 RepID=A0A7I7JX98_9MYCO|nr:hypothetical protein [Mycolicibacterium duvalii]MCV7370325.1 hypothetical protein [Mycolicibacterium duvalii]PEG37293.1 hypothetical protein CRI77_21260 [Mycolicibacterium duvalii]BBX16497.1 hypothetical protein MDUV_13570 [Mycolicibacterium duvalii]